MSSVHQQLTDKLEKARAERLSQDDSYADTQRVYLRGVADTLVWVLELIEREYADDA